MDVYTNIDKIEAKTKAETMFNGKTEIKATSQLISSYAWDTALNFICQNNKEYGYELATTTKSELANIGTNNKTQTGGYEADYYSNIYDFLGNHREWTTENARGSTTVDDGPYTARGGCYNNSSYYAASRYKYSIAANLTPYSFRVCLHIND